MNLRKLMATAAFLMPMLTSYSAAKADDADYTCWSPSVSQPALAVADYWTTERLENLVPEGETIPAGDGDGAKPLESLVGAGTQRAPIGDAPYKYGGQLVYTRGGVDYAASAQFVAEDNILVGAAHSMWKGGGHATNVRFYLGHAGADGPFFNVDRAAVLTAWLPVADNAPSLGRSALDYAALRTTAPSAVGKYELGINTAGVDDEVTITGYPARLEGGQYMYEETATINVKANNALNAVPHPMYGGGASGGAWFLSADNTKAVAVVSGGAPDHVFGAGFTDQTAAMIGYVKNGCQ